MKRMHVALLSALAILCFAACVNPTAPGTDKTVTLLAVPSLVAPVRGAAPVSTAIDTTQYSGIVSWAPQATAFAPATVYTATVELTAKAGWTLKGVAANSFTVAGATATHAADSGVVSAVFPVTDREINIVATVSNMDNVISEMGREPDTYLWNGSTYTKLTLPKVYLMRYKENGKPGLDFLINNNTGTSFVSEIRINGEMYKCLSTLKVGSSLTEAISVLGDPKTTLDGVAFPDLAVVDTLYKNTDGVAADHYYDNSSKSVRLFFSNNLATCVYIYGGGWKVIKYK